MSVSFDGFREHVVGQVQLALHDLARGAHQRGALDRARRRPAPSSLDLDVDAALRVQHRQRVACRRSARAALATVPGSAKAVATPMAPVDGMRGMAAARREVARGDAVARCRPR